MDQGGYGAYNPYLPGYAPGWRVSTPMSQREALSHGQVYGGRDSIDWLMDAVNMITNSASGSTYHFEDESGEKFVVEKDPTDPAALKDAPLLLANLFENPNPYMPWTELLELTLIDFLLVGNAYWVKWKTNAAGQPLALYRMAPPYVRIIPDQFGPAKYLYRIPGVQNEVEFTPDQVLHFRRPNPHNPYYGLGIVKGGARALDMEIALTTTSARYYEQAALPSGVVQTERRLPNPVFNKLKNQIRSFYAGSSNAGQLMVLEAGLKFTAISPDAGQAMFEPMGAWSRDRILAMFNLNKKLLGISDPDQTPIADWQRLFDQKTMLPLLNKFAVAISKGLTAPAWGLDFKFDYEESPAGAATTPSELLSRADLLSKLPGVKVHELRAAAGLPESTGDKTLDEMVLNLPGPNMDANGQGGTADRSLPGEAGRPPLPENTLPFSRPPSGQGGGTSARIAKKGGKAMTTADLEAMLVQMTDRARALAHEGKALPPANVHIGAISNATPPEDTLHATRTLEIDSLVAETHRSLQEAAHDLTRALLDVTEGKAEGTMYQRLKNAAAWAAFRARVTQILESAASRGLSLANTQHAKAGHQPNLDVDYAKTAKAQIGRPEGSLGIVQNLKAEIMQQILSLQRHGSNPGEYAKAVMAAMDQWKTGRAGVVALTEASIAYNEGTILVAEANGYDHVLVSDGEDDDEPCIAANGATWTLEEARANALEHPNCRRAFVPLPASAAS